MCHGRVHCFETVKSDIIPWTNRLLCSQAALCGRRVRLSLVVSGISPTDEKPRYVNWPMTMNRFWRYGLLLASVVWMGCRQNSTSVVESKPAEPVIHPESKGSTAPDYSQILVERVMDGMQVEPFGDTENRVIVLMFVSTECPIANRYAPEFKRLYATYEPKGVAFWLVFADHTESSDKIRQHLIDYQLEIPAVRDPQHHLVKFCEATRTPEAVVFSHGRQRQYRGRIDDRFTDYGKSRSEASKHDLQDAIDAVLEGKPILAPVTGVVGCYIPGAKK